MPRPLPRFRQGDFLTARTMNDLVDRVNRQRLTSGQGTGILIQETPDGTTIRVPTPGGRKLAQVSADVSARSGTTAGTGTVKPATADATARAIAVGTATLTVLNYFPVAIVAGKYCWIEQDDAGLWWVVSAEC